MRSFTPASGYRNSRATLASLLTCLMLAAPLTPFGFSSTNASQLIQTKSTGKQQSSRPSKAGAGGSKQEEGEDVRPARLSAPPVVVSPLSTTLTATKTDNIPLSSGVAAGQTISYTVTIQNSGAEAATGITFNDTIDADTTLTGAITASPLANDDSYSVIGNVRIQPNVAQGVLTNDAQNEATITGFGATAGAASGTTPGNPVMTTDGGTATLNADGSFSYDPAPGFTGTDEIFYTLSNSAGTNTAQVTFTVTGMVWFVNDDDPVAGGDGRLSNPFNCLVGTGCFSDSTLDEAGDSIFLYEGNYTGGQTLLNNQKLIGQATTATLAGIVGVTAPAYSNPLPATGGAAPVISNGSGNGITLGSDNTLRGLSFSNASGSAISGASVGSLIVSETSVNTTGQALNLTSGTISATFLSVTSSGGVNNINLSSIGGTLTMSGGALTESSSTAFNVSGGNAALTYNGNITNDNGQRGISAINVTGGSLTVSGTVAVSGSAGNDAIILDGNDTNAYTVSINAVSVNTNNMDDGILLADLPAGSSVTIASGSVTSQGVGRRVIAFETTAGVAENTAGTYNFSGVTFNNTNGDGLTFGLAQAGSYSFGAFTANTPSGTNPAVTVASSPAAVTFASISETGGTNGINISSATGSFTVTGTTTLGTSGARLTGAGASLVSNSAPVNLGTVSIFATNFGIDAVLNTGTITTGNGTVNASAGPALNISGTSAASLTPLSLALGDATANGGGGNGISLSFVSGTLNATGGAVGNTASPTGTAFKVNGGSANITYGGTVTQNNAQRAVDVQNKTGGTVAFGGAISAGSSSTGVLLNSNSGATVNFTGGMNLSTGANAAFTATGGGTVNVCDKNPCGTATSVVNTLTTTTATALNVANTTIGASGLTFRSISANGAANGIILNNTGMTAGVNGGLTVTGMGTTAGTGGTIQNNVQGALFTQTRDLVLKNMNFTNANSGNGTCQNVDNSNFNSACQAAINMNGVTTVTFDRLVMSGGSQVGINGRTVSALTITNSTVQNFGDNVNENDLRFFNLTGTCSFNNSTFQNPGEFIADIRNDTGTLNLTVDTVTFNDTDTSAFGAAGFSITSTSSSTINVNIDNSIFNRIVNAAFQSFARSTSTMNVNFTDSTVEQLSATTGRAVDVSAQDTAHLNFNINHNVKLYSKGGTAVNMFTIDNTVVQGRVNNNTDIRTGGVGSPGAGIAITPQDNSHAIVEVIGNTISQIGSSTDAGIRVLAFGDNISQLSPELDATVTGNNITLISNGLTGGSYVGGLFGIQAQGGSGASDQAKTCADVRSNAVSATPVAINNSDNIAFRTRVGSAGSKLYLEGFTTNSSTTWNNNSNTPINSTSESIVAGGTISAPPASAPYNGVCRQPTHVTSLARPDLDVLPPAKASQATQPPAQAGDVTAEQSMQLSEGSSQPLASLQLVSLGESKARVTDTTQTLAPQHVVQNRGDFNFSSNLSITNPLSTSAASSAVAQDASASKTKHGKEQQAAKSKLTDATPSFTSFPISIGTIPAGDSVTITFTVTVNAGTTGSVSNQGQVSGTNFSSPVSTNDPETATANDATVTNILPPPSISVSNASTNEPASGSKNMPFTVSLAYAFPAAISVNFQTADGTAKVADGDYTLTSGTLNFAAGQLVQTISVPVLADSDTSETDETFTVTLSAPTSGATIGTGTATGTITAANPSGRVLISEVRTSGPNGAGDDFIELYNNQDVAQDISGWAVFKIGASCLATPVIVGVIPAATMLAPRGHYLVVGSQYSLTTSAAGNATVADIESDRNLALFNTSNVLSLSTTTREDAVGFDVNAGGGNNCDLLREGASLLSAGGSASQYSFARNLITGLPKETNDNAADFLFVSTTPAVAVGNNLTPILGGPGPENLAAPIQRNGSIKGSLVDPGAAPTAPPNRARIGSATGPNAAFGTISFRRRFTNSTGVPVTRLRFRLVDVTAGPAPAGTADLRALSSSNVTVTLSGGGSLQVQGTTLETPPAQPNGGGLNSTLAAGTVIPGNPIASGATIDLQFVLGVQQEGSFRFLVNVEALPGPPPPAPLAGRGGEATKGGGSGKQQ